MQRSRLRHPGSTLSIFGLCAVVAGLAFVSEAQDWPQFRGESRNGTSSETGLLDQWPDTGPKEVWRRPIGKGYSEIAVVGGRLYTMYAGEMDGKRLEFAAAFDAKTGEELWKTALGDEFENEFGDGPRATPAVVGDAAFVIDSRGNLAALSTKDGSKRWETSLIEAYGATMPVFGFSASALVDDDRVVVQARGTEGRFMMAFDVKSGEVEWSAGETPQGASYNSAVIVEMNGQKCYVYVMNGMGGAGSLVCLDDAGGEVWSHEWPGGETHASPLFVPPNKIFGSGAEGVGGILVQVKGKGDKTQIDEVWKTRFMRNHFSSSVVNDGFIFGFDNATLKSIAVDDAELGWAKRGFGKGSLIIADGKLVVLSDRGELLLIEADGKTYSEKGSVQALEGRSWTAPSLSDGKLYLRNHTEMVVYDLKG